MSARTRHHSARVAVQERHKGAGHPDVITARRELAMAQLEESVERILASSPPLSDVQLERVAALLRAGRSGAAT